MSQSRRVLGISWYSQQMQDICVSLDDLIDQLRPRWLFRRAMSVGMLRGVFAFWAGRSFDIIVTTFDGKVGCGLTLTFLQACTGGNKKRVIVLEFFHGPGPEGRLKHAAYLLRDWLIVKPSIQRAVSAIHVLTDWERQHYANLFGIDVSRFTFIPFHQRGVRDEFPQKHDDGTMCVVSSGRYACDWDTLFKAADEQEWPLTVICSATDLPHVQRLNMSGRARVLCEIPLEEHNAHVRSASVYVLCLRELEVSSGHVRVTNAVRAGTAIVATRTKGLEGYLTNRETALIVEPGNYLELREAIQYLLAHPEYRTQLALKAYEVAGERTFEDYITRIKALVLSALDGANGIAAKGG